MTFFVSVTFIRNGNPKYFLETQKWKRFTNILYESDVKDDCSN